MIFWSANSSHISCHDIYWRDKERRYHTASCTLGNHYFCRHRFECNIYTQAPKQQKHVVSSQMFPRWIFRTWKFGGGIWEDEGRSICIWRHDQVFLGHLICCILLNLKQPTTQRRRGHGGVANLRSECSDVRGRVRINGSLMVSSHNHMSLIRS